MPRLETRYDEWHCVNCGALKVTRSIPHEAPMCCRTGMWWMALRQGTPYEVEDTTDA